MFNIRKARLARKERKQDALDNKRKEYNKMLEIAVIMSVSEEVAAAIAEINPELSKKVSENAFILL